MNVHNNARLTFRGRALLVKRVTEHGLRVEEAAQASGVSIRTAYKLQVYATTRWHRVVVEAGVRACSCVCGECVNFCVISVDVCVFLCFSMV